MISEAFEENPPSQQRYLQRLNINVDPVFMPCPRPETVGYKGREEAVEVEEKEERPARWLAEVVDFLEAVLLTEYRRRLTQPGIPFRIC
jgi:hypothetical protein